MADFKDKFITFSENPILQEVKGKDIVDKYKNIKSIVANTDIDKVFMLILKSMKDAKASIDDLPSHIIIISDMEFDCAVDSNDSTFEVFKKKFEKLGYKMPEIVFWNVRARSTHLPVEMNEDNVKLVSGASSSIIDMVTKNESTTPYEMMLKCLEKYSCFDSLIIE